MATATLRFYAELNDFLAPERRQRDWLVGFEPPVPVRHLIETCSVPHTEVELILRDGQSVCLEEPVTHGDRLAVYPMFDAFDVSSLVRRLQLCGSIQSFTRCTVCNGLLTALTRQEAAQAVPPRVSSRHREFWRCLGCGRIYWKGSHWESMRQRIESICADAFSDARAVQ